MNFLLDTNAVSEWMKPRPNPGVVTWLAEADEDRIFLSVVTLTELRYGAERLDHGRRRARLEEWLAGELLLRFEARILPITAGIADACGKIVARAEALGRRIEALDAFLAATAEIYSMTLVTPNTSDFMGISKSLLNPWTSL